MTNAQPLKIIVASGHPLFIEALASFLNTVPEWKVVGVAKNIEEARLLMRNNESRVINEPRRVNTVDLVIIDIHLPDSQGNMIQDGGLVLTAELRERYPHLKILIFSSGIDPMLVRRSLSAGASRYLTKESTLPEIRRAIDAVIARRNHSSPPSRKELQEVRARALLTLQEEKVMRLFSRRRTDKRIREKLKLKLTTIEKIRLRQVATRRYADWSTVSKNNINLGKTIYRDIRQPAIPGTKTVTDFGQPKLTPKKNIGRSAQDGVYATVRVFYATDRNRIPSANPTGLFGNKRGEKLSFGYCDVSIPRHHSIGELESRSIWRLEFRDDPNKHVVLLTTIPRSKDEFFGELEARICASETLSAFVFVHGYNVTFEDAARRAAQMSYDLAFDGAAVFYSWPSQGKTAAYTVDEQNIEWAQANLRAFLGDFFARSVAENVYLIAHSMGNRALTLAVTSLLDDHPSLKSRLKEVILTAPDIDADVFKRDIGPALTASGRPVTLYASSEDLALRASKRVHGYSRAGDSGEHMMIVPGVETVDATHVDTSLMGHSYFAGNRSVLSDMFYLICSGQRADARFGLRRIDVKDGCYWEFKR